MFFTVVITLAMSTFIQAEEGRVLQTEIDRIQESRWFRAMGMSLYATSALDIASTEIAMRAGGIEGNPFMRDRTVRVSWHIAAPIFVNWFSSKLYREGYTKHAIWLRIIANAIYAAATINNVGHF